MNEIEKKLIIKKKIYKRLKNECNFYKNEIIDLEKVIKLMVENDPDDYDINKKKEMLEESNETLKHVEKKREIANEELYNFIEMHLEDGMISNELITDIE
tara:strand:+ start:124 stop:423 length:300 start_codon:yes stop_codon:yes gene_type:complete